MSSCAKFATSLAALLALAGPTSAQDRDAETLCLTGTFSACFGASSRRDHFSWSTFLQSRPDSHHSVFDGDVWMNGVPVERWEKVEDPRFIEASIAAGLSGERRHRRRRRQDVCIGIACGTDSVKPAAAFQGEATTEPPELAVVILIVTALGSVGLVALATKKG